MATKDFTTSIVVDNPAEEVFSAINNVSAWWQGEIRGSTDKPGDQFDYRMKDFHFSRQKITEFIPGKKVVWLVTDSRLSSFENPSEWTGTKIIFEITELNKKTQLRFTHIGLVPAFRCYDDCSGAWEPLIRESLYSLITTGRGVNVFG